MFLAMMRSCAVLCVIVFINGCATGGMSKSIDSSTIHGAYSLLAPDKKGETIIYARIVVDGHSTQCPDLIDESGTVLPTSPRAFHPDSAGSNHFPITVCEAIIASETRYQDNSGAVTLSPVTLDPKNIQVYGDSGCKAKNCQPGTAAKQFEDLIKYGATLSPELILHMGDYNYRGTSGSIKNGIYTQDIYAYDAGDGGYGGKTCGLDEVYYSQNAIGSDSPDNWQNWYDDFFLPTKQLLSKAPWVFARGNHELCSRAGPGWFYFFGPGSSLPGATTQLQCPEQGTLASPPSQAIDHIQMIPAYFVKLKHLQLWVMDSANACDAGASNALTAQYQTWFDELQSDIGKQNTWMVTHRPTWGVDRSGDKETLMNTMLQVALDNTKEKRLPAPVTLSFSGHMHIFQTLSFDETSKRPPQLIVGNSGVSMENITDGTFSTTIDGEMVKGNELKKHGFLQINYHHDGSWKGNLLNKSGNDLAKCGSKQLQQVQTVCILQ